MNWRPRPIPVHPNDRRCWGRDGTCTTGRPPEVRAPGWWLCPDCTAPSNMRTLLGTTPTVQLN